VERSVNVLAFGILGQEDPRPMRCRYRLVEGDAPCCFIRPTARTGLTPQPNVTLNFQGLRKLDNFDFMIIDDLGYLPQGTQESEVLLPLIAERL